MYTIGGEKDEAVSIFYDLRPISELLSPILIPYHPFNLNPDNTEEVNPVYSRAPIIWRELRQSLEEYLRQKGLFGPLTDSLYQDYHPRTVSISWRSVSIGTYGVVKEDSSIIGGFLFSAPSISDQQVSFCEKETPYDLVGNVAAFSTPKTIEMGRVMHKGGDKAKIVFKIRMQAHYCLQDRPSNFQEVSVALFEGEQEIIYEPSRGDARNDHTYTVTFTGKETSNSKGQADKYKLNLKFSINDVTKE